jgi:hypothetical protein
MPRRCTVCDHPERHGIDGDVIERGRRMPRGRRLAQRETLRRVVDHVLGLQE